MEKPLRLSKLVKLTLAILLLTFFDDSQTDAKNASSNIINNDHTQLRLLSSITAVGKSETLMLGLHFTMKPGWKVYWRSPGDAGYPPSIDWRGSTNLGDFEMLWPIPQRFSILGLETLGYKNEVLFPIKIRLKSPGKSLLAVANIDYLTCNEICVPYKAKLALDLKAGQALPSDFVHIINRFVALVPGDGATHGVSIDTVESIGKGKQVYLRVKASSRTPFTYPDVFFEGPDVLVYDKPSVVFQSQNKEVILTSKVHGTEDLEPPNKLANLIFGVTVRDGDRSAERTLSIRQVSSKDPSISFGYIIVLALLGGLILNLMPCVLPVLSLKLLSIIGHGGGKKHQVQLSFIASAGGIIFSFILLAATLAVMKSADMTIGWGIQFQQSWFLIAMILTITLFACNLWGLFEFRLPYWISRLGENTAHIQGLSGNFLTGCFATLLATPCSAPFLGTAVGFALARDTIDIFAVFTALGFGLALPYLLVASIPSLATRLPKPGRWMITLRQAMGFALAGSTIWLLSILSNAMGQNIGLLVGSLTLSLIGILFLAKRLNKMRKIGVCGVAVVVLLAFSVPSLMTYQAPENITSNKDPRFKNIWQPLDVKAIPKLVADGKTVFVDVTADWCLTCQINKVFVISQDNILQRLEQKNVIAMQADWTLPDDAVTAYLVSFGRYGIPFNAVYSSKTPRGMVLPELLKQDAVIEALDMGR